MESIKLNKGISFIKNLKNKKNVRRIKKTNQSKTLS